MKKLNVKKNIFLAALMTLGVGFSLTGCYDREESREIRVDREINPDGSVTDTTIRHETTNVD
jgi:hypothetical protein